MEQGVAVVVVVMRGERVLLMRRSAHSEAAPGIWESVSGRVEPGEDPFDAAGREAREETGLQVRVDPRPVDAYALKRIDRPMVVIVYAATTEQGDVRLNEEHDAHRWATRDELDGVPPRLVEAMLRCLRATE